MTETEHINLQAPSITSGSTICLCGFTFIRDTDGYSDHGPTLWSMWIEGSGYHEKKPSHFADPTCVVCLERYPLALLALTDLE